MGRDRLDGAAVLAPAHAAGKRIVDRQHRLTLIAGDRYHDIERTLDRFIAQSTPDGLAAAKAGRLNHPLCRARIILGSLKNDDPSHDFHQVIKRIHIPGLHI
jgi:hypothetical protein